MWYQENQNKNWKDAIIFDIATQLFMHLGKEEYNHNSWMFKALSWIAFGSSDYHVDIERKG